MVREGYKDTEIGVLPEDWELINFEDCLELLPNNTLSRAELNYNFGEVKNIHYGDILMSFPAILDCSTIELPFINSGHNIKNNRSFLKNGDIVIADTAEDNTVGKATEVFAIEEQKIVAGLHTIPCRPKVMFESKWLGYFINNTIYHNQLLPYITGTKVSAISKSSIKQTKIAKPLAEEQKAIATALSDIDELIISIEKLIIKKKAIKKATMQELLTGEKRISGFTKPWQRKKLGELGVITGAGVDKKINANEEKVRLVNYLDVYHRDFIYSKQLNHVVSAPQSKVNQCGVKKGDIYFTPSSEMRNDIGLSAVAMEDIDDAVYSYHIVRLRLFEDWDLNFRAYIFKTKHFFDQAETFCEGSGKRYVISLKKFRELEIVYPGDKDEQQAISKILSDMDLEIDKLQLKLNKYKDIKQGMMQELLTGRIRLI